MCRSAEGDHLGRHGRDRSEAPPEQRQRVDAVIHAITQRIGEGEQLIRKPCREVRISRVVDLAPLELPT